MYNRVKNVVKSIIPKSLLFWSEPFLRRYLLYPFYVGKNYACTVCGATLKKFVVLPDSDKLCPCCGSLARDRRLMSLLNEFNLEGTDAVLDFSPSRCNYRKLKSEMHKRYHSTDLSGDFISDNKYDISNIDIGDETFDLIICYHVLEHVTEDEKAMRELYRVLKTNGTCLVQTPFKEGEIYEDAGITSKADRLRAFGQEDHVRIYSVSGLKSRLQHAGFEVNVLTFNEKPDNKSGYAQHETVLVVKKPQ